MGWISTPFTPMPNESNAFSKGLRKFRKRYPIAVRRALERLFKIWLRKYAKKRFTREGMRRYKNLQNHYKRHFQGVGEYDDKWLSILSHRVAKGTATDEPLVSSGSIKKAFLEGSYKVTRSSKYGSIRVTWTQLPKSAKTKKKNQNINIPLALTEITEQELREMGKVFNRLLQKELNRIDKGSVIKSRLAL